MSVFFSRIIIFCKENMLYPKMQLQGHIETVVFIEIKLIFEKFSYWGSSQGVIPLDFWKCAFLYSKSLHSFYLAKAMLVG